MTTHMTKSRLKAIAMAEIASNKLAFQDGFDFPESAIDHNGDNVTVTIGGLRIMFDLQALHSTSDMHMAYLELLLRGDKLPAAAPSVDPIWSLTPKCCPRCKEWKKVVPDFGVFRADGIEQANGYCNVCRRDRLRERRAEKRSTRVEKITKTRARKAKQP